MGQLVQQVQLERKVQQVKSEQQGRQDLQELQDRQVPQVQQGRLRVKIINLFTIIPALQAARMFIMSEARY
jgi:hypothetical protein